MVSEKVISVIANTKHVNPETISLDSSFEELEIDSLDGVEIVYCLEEEYKISVPDETMKEFRTVRDVVDALEKFLSERPADAAEAAPG
jgi:acyl carrier protein